MSNSIKKADVNAKPNQSPEFNEKIINAFCEGLQKTIESMANVKIAFGKPSLELNWKTTGDITGIVDFDTSNFKGSIYIHFHKISLINFYNTILGENQTDINEDVIDCIGEISNMAYGVAKGILDPLKLNFSMSLPKKLRTIELSRLNTPHILIPFVLFEKDCQLEISLFKK